MAQMTKAHCANRKNYPDADGHGAGVEMKRIRIRNIPCAPSERGDMAGHVFQGASRHPLLSPSAPIGAG